MTWSHIQHATVQGWMVWPRTPNQWNQLTHFLLLLFFICWDWCSAMQHQEEKAAAFFSPSILLPQNNNTMAAFDGVNVRLHVGGHPAESQCKNPDEIKRLFLKMGWCHNLTTANRLQAGREIKEILGVDRRQERTEKKIYHRVWKNIGGEEEMCLIGGGEGFTCGSEDSTKVWKSNSAGFKKAGSEKKCQ